MAALRLDLTFRVFIAVAMSQAKLRRGAGVLVVGVLALAIVINFSLL